MRIDWRHGSGIQTSPNTPSRERTDVICTVISTLFAIGMFIAACVMWDRDGFQRKFGNIFEENFTEVCENGAVYYPNVNDLEKFQCVEECPKNFELESSFCLPKSEPLRSQYTENDYISQKLNNRQFPKFLFYLSLISLGVGILWLILVVSFSRVSVKLNFFLAVAILFGIGLILFLVPDRFWNGVIGLKITVGVLCFILGIVVVLMTCLYRNELKLHGIFLEYALLYLKEHSSLYLYIPFFLILSFGLVVLITWQHICFISKNSTSDNFFNLNGSGIWGVLNIIELIWGIQFLRDSFNFIISGKFVEYYWNRSTKDNCCSSIRYLLCYHWGSVVAGSFINAFFTIPNMILDIFRCNTGTCCHNAGENCSKNCFSPLFDLVRTDVYSYINYSGLGYCEAARECKKICGGSEIIAGMHSPMKNYRFIAHVVVIGGIFLGGWFLQRAVMQSYGVWNYGIYVVIVLMIVTWFISIFSDSAEALQTCFLAERLVQSNYQQMQGGLPQFREDFEHIEKRVLKDGNC